MAKSKPKNPTHPVFISKAIHVDIATAAAILSGRLKSRITLRQVAEMAIVTFLAAEGLPSSVILQERALTTGPGDAVDEREEPQEQPHSPTGLTAPSGALEEAAPPLPQEEATAVPPEAAPPLLQEEKQPKPLPDLSGEELVRRGWLDPSHPDYDPRCDPMRILGLRLPEQQ